MNETDYIKLRNLTEQFYTDNNDLEEALDGSENGKVRGYGIIVIDINELKFGIPLRSNMNHRFGFIFERSAKGNKGLDYTKALLIKKDEYISRSYKIPSHNFVLLNDNKEKIQSDFSKFVERYVLACNKQDSNILNNYRYSTLKNYHEELGIQPLKTN